MYTNTTDITDIADIIVTGSRNWPHGALVIHNTLFRVRQELMQLPSISIRLKVGDAIGVDTYAYQFWISMFGRETATRFKADWPKCDPEDARCYPEHRKTRYNGKEYCPLAGFRRNKRMVYSGGAVLCAFPTDPHRISAGTHDTIAWAIMAGIPYRIYDSEGQIVI